MHAGHPARPRVRSHRGDRGRPGRHADRPRAARGHGSADRARAACAAAQAPRSEGVRFLLDVTRGSRCARRRSWRRSSTRCRREGRALEPLRLLGLADYLESIEHVAQVGRARPALSAPSDAAGRGDRVVPRRDRRRAAQDRAVGRRGRQRQPGARQHPRSAAQAAEPKLRSTLESFLRERDTSKYLQEQVVTDRNGRYVLMVRAEHRGAIPGIVHGASASGAEPVPRAARHRGDQQRHRRARGAGGRGSAPHPAGADRRVPRAARRSSSAPSTSPTELDVIQARARFSQMTGGIEPSLAADGALELRGARHPLLLLRDRDAARGRGRRDADAATPLRKL